MVCLTALSATSILARSTKTTTAVLPLRCSLRSHVEGVVSLSSGKVSVTVSRLRFRFLLLVGAEDCEDWSEDAIALGAGSDSKEIDWTRPAGRESWVEKRCLKCGSVASMGTLTRKRERELVGVGISGVSGLR